MNAIARRNISRNILSIINRANKAILANQGAKLMQVLNMLAGVECVLRLPHCKRNSNKGSRAKQCVRFWPCAAAFAA